MQYVFKPGPEVVWAFIVAVVAVLAEATQGAMPTDYRTWAVAVAAGLVRAVLGIILHVAGGPQTND